jgi:hypothetical protein
VKKKLVLLRTDVVKLVRVRQELVQLHDAVTIVINLPVDLRDGRVVNIRVPLAQHCAELGFV